MPKDAPDAEYAASLVDLAAALGRTQPLMSQWMKRADWPFGEHKRGKRYHVPTIREWAKKLSRARSLGSVTDDRPLTDDELAPAVAATVAATNSRTVIDDASDIGDRIRLAKHAKLVAECALLETRKLIQEGRYVSRDTIEREWRGWVTLTQNLFVRLPHEFAKQHKLPAQLETALDVAIRKALRSIAEQARGRRVELDDRDTRRRDRTASEDDAE